MGSYRNRLDRIRQALGDAQHSGPRCHRCRDRADQVNLEQRDGRVRVMGDWQGRVADPEPCATCGWRPLLLVNTWPPEQPTVEGDMAVSVAASIADV